MTSVSETGYIDKVDDIVRKYNKAYHSTIFDSSKLIIKILHLKLVI